MKILTELELESPVLKHTRDNYADRGLMYLLCI